MTERWSRREIGLRKGFSPELMDSVDRQLARMELPTPSAAMIELDELFAKIDARRARARAYDTEVNNG
jgi:hypothetical protein